MKLSDWLRKYRQDSGYTLRDLANATGLTHGYLGALEKSGINPSTGKLYKPSLDTLKKLAAGTHHTLEELAAEVEDINLPADLQTVNAEEEKLLSRYRRLSAKNRQTLNDLASTFLVAQSATAMSGAL